MMISRYRLTFACMGILLIGICLFFCSVLFDIDSIFDISISIIIFSQILFLLFRIKFGSIRSDRSISYGRIVADFTKYMETEYDKNEVSRIYSYIVTDRFATSEEIDAYFEKFIRALTTKDNTKELDDIYKSCSKLIKKQDKKMILQTMYDYIIDRYSKLYDLTEYDVSDIVYIMSKCSTIIGIIVHSMAFSHRLDVLNEEINALFDLMEELKIKSDIIMKDFDDAFRINPKDALREMDEVLETIKKVHDDIEIRKNSIRLMKCGIDNS